MIPTEMREKRIDQIFGVADQAYPIGLGRVYGKKHLRDHGKSRRHDPEDQRGKFKFSQKHHLLES